MGIRPEDHLSGSGKHFARKLVDYCLVRRDIDAAVALCAGKAKHMVVLIDCPTYRAETVMAVGQHIRNRKLFKSACPCSLDNPDKGNIVGSQLVKTQL